MMRSVNNQGISSGGGSGPSNSQIEAAKERIRNLGAPSEDEFHNRGSAPRPGMVYGRQDLDTSLELINIQTSAFNNAGPPPRRPLRHYPIPEVPRLTKDELDSAFAIGEDSDDEDEDGGVNGDAPRLDLKADKLIADVSRDVGRNLCTNGHPLNPLTAEEAAVAEKSGADKPWVNKPIVIKRMPRPIVANSPEPTVNSSDIKDNKLNKDEVKDSPDPSFDPYWRYIEESSTLERPASPPKARNRNLTAQYFGSNESLARAKKLEVENLAKKAAHTNDVEANSKKDKSTVSREQTNKETLNSSKFIRNETEWTEIDLNGLSSSTLTDGPLRPLKRAQEFCASDVEEYYKPYKPSTSAPPRPLERARNLADMVIDDYNKRRSSLRQGNLELEPKPTGLPGGKSKFTERPEETLELPDTDQDLVKGEQKAVDRSRGKTGQLSEKGSDNVQNDEAHEGEDGRAETKTEPASEGGKVGISRRNTQKLQPHVTPTVIRARVQTLQEELAGTEFLEENYDECHRRFKSMGL